MKTPVAISLLSLLSLSALFTGTAFGTRITFENAASGNNADIALNYGSNIAGNGTGFITTDGSGATPNIGLTWLGNVPNEWEYHTSSVWTHESPVHVLQMDHGAGEPPTDNIADVVFTPIDGRSVVINSFLLSGSTGQGGTNQFDWEVVGTGVNGTEMVAAGGNTGTVNVGFTGNPGEEYTLRFKYVPGFASGRGTVLDDLSFSEVLQPGVPVFKLTVDRATGGITLTNTLGTAAPLKGYSITSESGSLNQANWKSISDAYDASGNQSVDTDDNWTELPQSGANSDFSEFEFGGNGGSIAASSSIVLNQPGGNAWLKSPFEDLELEIALADGSTPKYTVDYVNGPAGGYKVGDLNFDDTVDILDWPIYNSGRGVDYSNASLAEAYQGGDLDGDKDNDIADFVLFKSIFIAAQGAGAWETLVTGVPEPAAWTLIGTLFVYLGIFRRRELSFATGAFRGHYRIWTILLSALYIATATNHTGATTVTFATDPLPNNNSDLPTDFGSFITGSASDTNNGFITTDGTGATPNIGLIWGPTANSTQVGTANNVLEFHSGTNLLLMGDADPNNDFTAPILQFDLDTSLQPGVPNDPSIDFNVTNGATFKMNSFDIGHANNQTAPAFAWTIDLIRLSDMATVASHTTAVMGPGDKETVNFDYIGDDGESYRLQFNDGGANTVNTAFDDLSFSEVPNGSAPRLKLVVNKFTGNVQIQNDSGFSYDINSYEILSDPGDLDPKNLNSLRNAGIGGNGDPNLGLGWLEAGGNDDDFVAESYFLGSSTISNGITPIDLGDIFKGGQNESLKFRYHIEGEGAFNQFGYVEYVDPNFDTDFNDDGLIDGLDFLVWQTGVGATGATNAMGDANGDMLVNGADLALWEASYGNSAQQAALTTVPEPGSLSLLALGLAASFGLVRRRGSQGVLNVEWSSRISVLVIATVCVLSSVSTLRAAVHLDRLYEFGDGGASGLIDSEVPGFGDDQNLSVPAGATSPSFVDVTTGTFARAGVGAGERAAQFDPNDVLSGIQVNRPDETYGTSVIGDGPEVFGSFNYDTITARGLQMWVYPESASLGNGRQGIVMDTIAAGGVSITADGNWTQTNDSILDDGLIEARVPVVGDQWHHVMHHIHLAGEPEAPRILAGGEFDRGFTGVVYVNGIAVSANNGEPAPGEKSSGSFFGGLTVGAEEVPGPGFEAAYGNHFDGLIDDLEMYVYGDNTSVQTFPAGQDYGTFNLFADNDWIADEISQIPNGGILRPGDVNRDGFITVADETAMKNGWMQQKTFQGFLNEIAVGDWETWAWGDLNTDGIVNLDDAIILDSEFALSGLGGLNFDRVFGNVPEPSSLLIATFGALSLLARRRLA